jgi:hypothetical protein
MKSPKFSVRDCIAIIIALASLAGLVVMFQSEGHVVLSQYAAPMSATFTEYGHQVLPNLQKYSLAFGLILLAASIAYILLGHEEELSTSLDEQELKK